MKESTPSQQIDRIITQYGGWKGELIRDLREIILAADPEIIEEIKWKMRSRPEGLPVWSRNGIVCFIETFKNDSKLVFFKGSSLNDSAGLFNARLQSKDVRAIEFHEGDSIDKSFVADLTELVVQAVGLNASNSH